MPVDVPPSALAALRRVWGYDGFRPGQDDAVAAVFDRRDVLAVLPTGGGKSLIYQVPAVARDGLTLVVSPLIALMHDQVQALRQRGVRAAALHGRLSARAADQMWTDAEHGLYRLLYLTPERLQTDLFRARAPRLPVDLLAVDEAHCISEWGHDFRPAYREIAQAREILTNRSGRPSPAAAVTATATPEVRRDIVDQLQLRDPAVVVRGFDRPNLVWSLHHVQDPVRQVLDVLRGVPGSALVYAGTRRGTERLAARLQREGVAAAPYHAGLDPDKRDSAQAQWLSGEVRVIVATSAFGMGIDKPDVRSVIHTTVPPTLEAYYQEAGRAGRDGDRAYAVFAIGPDAARVPESFVEDGHPTAADVGAVYEAVASLGQVAVGSLPERPTSVDLARAARVSGQSLARVQAAITRIAETGAWSPVQERDGTVSVRLLVGRDRLAEAVGGEAVSVVGFADAVVRALPPAGAEDWVTVPTDRLSSVSGLAEPRVLRGLDFLAARGWIEVRRLGEGLTLEWHRPRSATAPVDARALDQARRRTRQRLDAVLRYAGSVGCRRQHLLAYFGEASAGRCGRCDVCLGRHRPSHVLPDDEPTLQGMMRSVADGGHALGPEAAPRDRELADWLVHEGLLDVTDPLAGRFAVTPKGLRYLARTSE